MLCLLPNYENAYSSHVIKMGEYRLQASSNDYEMRGLNGNKGQDLLS